jgi:calcium/proton exchanger cax
VTGGIRSHQSSYNLNTGTTQGSLLSLSTALLLVVFVFDFAAIEADSRSGVATISVGVSVLSVLLFTLFNCFRYYTHTARFDQEIWADDYQDGPLRNDDASNDTMATILAPIPAAISALLSFALIIPCALIVTRNMSHTTQHVKSFYSYFVIPVLLKSPLHAGAVAAALKQDMGKVIDTTVGGTVQLLYLHFPVLVLLSQIRDGDNSMTMLFEYDQVIIMALAVFILNPILSRGTSTFLDGGMLLVMYVASWYSYRPHPSSDIMITAAFSCISNKVCVSSAQTHQI